MSGIIRVARRPAGWVAPGPVPPGERGREELVPRDDEDLCYLSGEWRLFQKRRGHRWSLDDLMTAWVAARQAQQLNAQDILDLGCGLGSVLLMLAWRRPQAHLTGIEAQADRAEMARRSILYNGVEDRCRVIDGDLRDMSLVEPSASFSLVTGTPPYFPRGSGTESLHTHAMPCRFEARGGVEDYVEAAARWLAPHGILVLCTSMLEDGRAEAAAQGLGLFVSQHLEVIPREGKAALIAIDVLSRRDRPPLAAASLTVRDAQNQWTAEFRQVRQDMGMPSGPYLVGGPMT